MKNEDFLENLREAYWQKKIAEEAYADALNAYKATDPEQGTVQVDDILIIKAKDGVRKTFDSKKFKAVYGVTEYERFQEEKPQVGAVSIRLAKADDGGGF